MKQSFLVLIAIFCFTSLNAQDSELFIITKGKIQGKEIYSVDKEGIGYSDRLKSIVYIEDDKIYSTYEVKKGKGYYEQGLYIEEYLPSNLLDKGAKRIYRFAYDSKGGTPVLITKIVYKTKSDYLILFYYTDYYFELRKRVTFILRGLGK